MLSSEKRKEIREKIYPFYESMPADWDELVQLLDDVQVETLKFTKPDENELELLLMNTEFSDDDIDRSDIRTFYLRESGLSKILQLIPRVKPDEKLREEIAELEHEQWMQWAGSILKTEAISKERAQCWRHLMIPYEQLTEEQKDQDRLWADKALALFPQVRREEREKTQKLHEACQAAYQWYYQGKQGDYDVIGNMLKEALRCE